MTVLSSQRFVSYENKKGPSLTCMKCILTPAFLLQKYFKCKSGYLLKLLLKLFITKAAENGKEEKPLYKL